MDMGAVIGKYRAWILALFLALCGLLIYFILEPIGGDFGGRSSYNTEDNPSARDSIIAYVRSALASSILFGGLASAFALEPLRWRWALIFGLIAGLVIGGIAYGVSTYENSYFIDSLQFWSGLLALAIAVPLFQNIRDNGAIKFEYDRLHFYAWSDVVIFFAAALFALLSWLLFFAIASLFQIIGIALLKILTHSDLFRWIYIPASFGAALGVLRDHDKILGAIQNVVLIILSILALPFAIALIVFLWALVFGGFDTLWNSTDSPSVLLILCAVWAIILANSIIRNNAAETSQSQILQYSAIVLAICVLPLGFIASVSAGLRIGQYGFTPDRLWGFLIIIIACAYGLAYLVNIARRRLDWAQYVRKANIKLAIGLCALALFLALPIANFASISAHHQISLYNSGQLDDESFDYAAMAFDFGPKGRALLKEKAITASDVFKQEANRALAADNKWSYRENKAPTADRNKIIRANILAFEGVVITDKMIASLIANNYCEDQKCAISPMSARKFFVIESAKKDEAGKIKAGRTCEIVVAENSRYCTPHFLNNNIIFDDLEQFEIRDVTRKQLFIGDKPIGNIFESEN